MGVNKLTNKLLTGAPMVFFVHLKVHQETYHKPLPCREESDWNKSWR